MPAGGHSIQQWRKFLCSSSNKTSLVKFLVGEWKLQGYRYNAARQGKALYVTCEETCFKMTADEWVEVAELQSTRRSRHLFAFACCKNWFEGSHSHHRRHRCHVALSCFPKGYPTSNLSDVWDTEQHTIC